MKKESLPLFLFIVLTLLSVITSAQAPAAFNFQGVARSSFGNPPAENATIAIRFTIRTGTTDGAIAYRETRSVQTNQYGVFSTVIGGAGATATTGNLGKVVWNSESKFLQVEMDISNGSGFIDLGTTQLLSVPFAMYSNNAAYADSSRFADTAVYSRSASNYFFEAVFPEAFPQGYLELLPGTIKFPNTTYNHINKDGQTVYDSTTGFFTAPAAGIYHFEIRFGTDSDVHELYLMKNAAKFRIFRAGSEKLSRRVYLNAGDVISILYEDDEPEANYQLNDGEPTHYFSGYKIY